jgi:hypothetical protein
LYFVSLSLLRIERRKYKVFRESENPLWNHIPKYSEEMANTPSQYPKMKYGMVERQFVQQVKNSTNGI